MHLATKRLNPASPLGRVLNAVMRYELKLLPEWHTGADWRGMRFARGPDLEMRHRFLCFTLGFPHLRALVGVFAALQAIQIVVLCVTYVELSIQTHNGSC